MNIMSAQSAHWTDEQIMNHLYGVGPAGGHLSQCDSCSSRLTAMQSRRQGFSIEDSVSDQFLAAQRRAIYARLSKTHHWWQDVPVRRWAAGVAMFTVVAGSAALYQDHRQEIAESRADAQLAQDVSQMSYESEPQATAPLQGLFIEGTP
jgi:hypothetical protein